MNKNRNKENVFFITAIIFFVLSAVCIFIPVLTPPKDLSVPGKTTFSEFFADLSFFLFFIGSLMSFVKTFFKRKINE